MLLEVGAKDYPKWMVYDNYLNIFKESKNYNKLTKNAMLKEIVEFYQDPIKIRDICSFQELEFLRKVIAKKISWEQARRDFHFEFTNLEDKFLIVSGLKGTCIPDDYLKSVKKALKLIDKKRMKEIDDLNDILIGALKIYGVLSEESLVYLANYYLGIDEKEVIDHMNNNLCFNFYAYKLDSKDDITYAFNQYRDFDYDLMVEINKTLRHNSYYLRDIDEVVYLRYHIFDDRKDSMVNFLNLLDEYKFYYNNFLTEVYHAALFDYKRDYLREILEEIPCLEGKDLNPLIHAMNLAMDDMPSAVLLGRTAKEYDGIKLEEKYNKKYNSVYKNLKENEDIQDYKKLREKVDELITNANMYNIESKRKDLELFHNVFKKNDLLNIQADPNIINCYLAFHKIKDRLSFFEEYTNSLMILSKDYNIANQVLETSVESVFEIKKLDSSKGKVLLEDIYTGLEYEIMDVALSCGDKSLIGNLMYIRIVTVNKITFSVGFTIVLDRADYPNIIEEIKEEMTKVKTVEDEETKKFIAVYKLSQLSGVRFSYRTLN